MHSWRIQDMTCLISGDLPEGKDSAGCTESLAPSAGLAPGTTSYVLCELCPQFLPGTQRPPLHGNAKRQHGHTGRRFPSKRVFVEPGIFAPSPKLSPACWRLARLCPAGQGLSASGTPEPLTPGPPRQAARRARPTVFADVPQPSAAPSLGPEGCVYGRKSTFSRKALRRRSALTNVTPLGSQKAQMESESLVLSWLQRGASSWDSLGFDRFSVALPVSLLALFPPLPLARRAFDELSRD
ncbi:40S ribosomal protein S7 isoform X1 [Zalophus californianus]|uniref:40S ribosomal protein S7 isoform X1 n=1 Tax=Zalophus californianus TaxID=9704 RepID=A0A6J2FCJ9_ZALCA|nr:40S ribosomal protein S7 isoform X1 [Zalophus californianus]XP_027478396.1 40S ribosomal protein S7 isoform X1 [Zalophus californianus]